MNKVQFITGPDGDSEFAVLPVAEYQALKAAAAQGAENAADAADARDHAAVMAALASGEEEMIPDSLLAAIDAGENPIAAWRKFRGLKAGELAGRVGISASYLSQIETGKRDGTLKLMLEIARELNTDVELLVPPREQQ